MEHVKKVKWIYSAFSACLVLLGIALLIWPDMTASLFCRICGALLVLFGVIKLIGYFSRDLLQLAFQFDFAMGVVSILLGVTMFFWWKQMMEAVIIGIGLFMLIDALLRVQTSIDAKRIGVNQWWVILLISLVTAVIGTMLFLRPYNWSKIVVMMIGLCLIIDGELNFFVVQSTVSSFRGKDLDL